MPRWTRRQFTLRTLTAFSTAVAAQVSGLVPEFGVLVAAAREPSSEDLPWWARKPVKQTEITGDARASLVQRVVDSADAREVRSGLPNTQGRRPEAVAVRNMMVDGSTVTSMGVALDDQHVLFYYETDRPAAQGERSRAFSYRIEEADGKATAKLVKASKNGKAIERVRPAASPASGAPSTQALQCGPTEYACYVCCSFDIRSFSACCGACAINCLSGWLICAICVGAWCPACAVLYCYGYCDACCPIQY